ncbi:MAG: putative endonuclease 4 [Candidatus Uhrbacteria bacterium GW2011_GWF2_41_16]|jgi:deoxyribonuclease-4|uniref:Probable endonuclease 4 n=2 Tax=Candidatus Uhriibacteriota TaxID=1752732 RepID=A0A0G0VDS5_9BACT|nr:MAG: putative endonuclease 4 [Candidatus Uhrbacteria bacterium GW2011_GWC2_41_11]KKR97806.1 MAG: putative endonuclease 4 [Candidatus Uhrbacteria bacterium GW2011_GWF2_41_16]HBP00267.1 hypothetical protein [Candidatus Uhrbacteria bacterium]
MRFGAHVSAAGGVWNAPEHAASIGCEVLQMFSRPPQGGTPAPITAETIQKFQTSMKEHGIHAAYIHAPYFINLASGEARIRHGSIQIIRDELERGSLLHCRSLMFHPGSGKDLGQEKGMQAVVEGLDEILDGYKGTCQLLIEISAGAGMILGDSFEEIAYFLNKTKYGKKIGVCFDTQHAFASGYDIRTKEAWEKTIEHFDILIGLERLVLSHCNDSKTPFESHKDRHEHLGKGSIGLSAFKILVQHPKLQHIDLILETPFEPDISGIKKDLQQLKKFRNV